MNTTLKILAPLAVVFALLVATNVIYAAWDKPSVAPPGDNVDAPINVGNTEQTKTGKFNIGDTTINGDFIANKTAVFLDTLGVLGKVLIQGDVVISNLAAKLIFDPTNGAQWALQAFTNSSALDSFQLIYDRNGDGVISWSGDGPWPLTISGSESYARFEGEVRANEYCDENGDNCTDLTDGPNGSGGLTIGTDLESLFPDEINHFSKRINACEAKANSELPYGYNDSTRVNISEVNSLGIGTVLEVVSELTLIYTHTRNLHCYVIYDGTNYRVDFDIPSNPAPDPESDGSY